MEGVDRATEYSVPEQRTFHGVGDDLAMIDLLHTDWRRLKNEPSLIKIDEPVAGWMCLGEMLITAVV